MEVTIKIDQRNKNAKLFLNFMKSLEYVEIVEPVQKKYPISKNVPNEETKKVFKDTDSGKGLLKAKNSKELFKELGI